MRDEPGARRSLGLMRALALALLFVSGAPAAAGDLSSASFRMVGAHASSVGAQALPSSGPRFSASAASLGQGDALGFAGSPTTLTTLAPGFLPIVAGSFPSLDVDGDGLPSWLDEDDDGDGLPDAIERDTGVFRSASDPGTSAVLADSDGDGFGDGAEVTAGSDPNNAGSTPAAPQVPVAPAALLVALALALAVTPRALRLAQRR